MRVVGALVALAALAVVGMADQLPWYFSSYWRVQSFTMKWSYEAGTVLPYGCLQTANKFTPTPGFRFYFGLLDHSNDPVPDNTTELIIGNGTVWGTAPADINPEQAVEDINVFPGLEGVGRGCVVPRHALPIRTSSDSCSTFGHGGDTGAGE